MLPGLRAGARIGAAIVVVLACLSRPSEACGVWSVRDRTQSWLVVFRSMAIDVVHHSQDSRQRKVVSIANTRRPSRDYDWRLMQRGPGENEWHLGDKAFRVQGGTIRLDGRPVGGYSRARVWIGKKSFGIAFGKHHGPAGPYSVIPDNQGRSLTVTREGIVVLDGVASGPPHCPDPVRLIAVYLAWRELLFPHQRH